MTTIGQMLFRLANIFHLASNLPSLQAASIKQKASQIMLLQVRYKPVSRTILVAPDLNTVLFILWTWIRNGSCLREENSLIKPGFALKEL